MYKIRNVNESDCAVMRYLAQQCSPLDIHTQYTYWVNATFFSRSSFILELKGEPIGYIMSVENIDTLFIWQIGILPEYRGRGFSFCLISSCFDYALSCNKKIQVTIAKDNLASYSSFISACNKKGFWINKLNTIHIIDKMDPSFDESEELYEIYYNSPPGMINNDILL